MNLQTKSAVPLYEQIYEFIKKEIRNEKLICGEKLPSTRALAKHLGVSRSTIDLAYEQLLSEGYIESVPCKGFYVAELEGLYHQETWKDMTKKTVQNKEKKYRYDFSPYGIDLKSFPYNTWRKLSKEILIDDRTALFKSGCSQGEEHFRTAIKNYLYQARGVHCDEEQIVIGAGNDYLLMLLSMMIGTDKKIAFENPTYKQAYHLFENLGYRVTTVDMDKSGMCVDQLQVSEADLAYVMPSHQYPLGIVMPMKRRMELLRWASEKEGRYIIEDDYDSEFRYKGKPIPSLQGYDHHQKVIYLGTFSRAIAPAIRISYMVLPEPLLEIYKQKCAFMSCTVPRVDQYIVQLFMERGYFERHLNKMRAIYKSRHDALVMGLKPLTPKCSITGEYAGMHLLLTFPETGKEEEMIQAAAKRQIKVYGLSKYYIKKQEKSNTTLILGFANLKEEQIEAAVRELCEVWK